MTALPGLHCTPAKYQLCQSAGQLSVLTCTYPETWVHGTTGPRSSCLLSTGCLQISTGLSMLGGRFYILTVHIFHIDICSDHSLDNLLILPAYFKTQVMIFCKNKQWWTLFFVKYGWWMDIPWENYFIFAFWCLKYSTCNKIIFSFQ